MIRLAWSQISVFFACLAGFCLPVQGQTGDLGQLLLAKVNELRAREGLHPMEQDVVLEKAAETQAKYLKSYGRLTHKHRKPRLAWPVDRVRAAKGWHDLVGESILALTIETPDPEDLANRLLKAWQASRADSANLLNPDYFRSGLGFTYDRGQNRLYAVWVLASLPPDLEAIPYPRRAYGVAPYNQFTCRPCQGATNRLLQDQIDQRIGIREGKIYFYFPDLELFKKVYPYKGFSFAADVLMREQFPCGNGNQLHGSPVHDGYMTQPLKRDKLLKNNLDPSGKALIAELGSLPPGISGEVEVNLLLMFAKTHCKSLMATPVYASTLSPLPFTPHLIALDPGEAVEMLRKEIHLTIPFEKDKYEYAREDIAPLYDSLRLNRFHIKAIELSAYASVEGPRQRNELLQQKRAESIVRVLKTFQLDTVETRIQTFENWREFQRDIMGTPFSYLRRYSQDSVKYLLAQDSLAAAIEPLLRPHRKAEIRLRVEEKIEFREEAELLPRLYRESLAARESLREMLRLQAALFRAIEAGRLPEAVWDSITVPDEAGFALLHYNDMVFGHQRGRPWPGFYSLKQLEAWSGKRPDMRIQLYGLMVEQWRKDVSLISDAAAFLEKIQALYKQRGVSPEAYFRVLYNFHLTYLGHLGPLYRSAPLRKELDASVDFISDYFRKQELNPREAYTLANFLVFFRHFEEAATLLRPYTEGEGVSEELLFYYLSLILQEQYRSEEGEFHQKMAQAKAMNPARFCRLFGHPELSFQLLRDYYLKGMYCEECE